MAKFNAGKLRNVYIDGEATPVAARAKIIDVVNDDVTSVRTINPDSGKYELITRDQFERDMPEGISTDLTSIDKG
jgi:hypothetical protein